MSKKARKVGSELKEDLMPERCRSGVDLLHMDKGKIVTVGNYPDPLGDGSRKDMTCLEARYANYPYETTVVTVDNANGAIEQFTVDHHGQKIKTAKAIRSLSLPLIYGTRFDIAFKEAGECRFDEAKEEYPIKTSKRKTEEIKEPERGTYHAISCRGTSRGDASPTRDKLRIIDRARRKEKKKAKSKSILNEFLDAGKYINQNKQVIEFGSEGGKLTFTPFYFTEQWAFLRTSKQLKAQEPYPSASGERKNRPLKVRAKRILREIDFLMGTDEFSERSTLVDIEGKSATVNGDPVGEDPNTYAITKALVDPAVIDSTTMTAPRYGKARTVELKIKPQASCELRTNFKRGRSEERILFCSANDASLDDKAKGLFV